VEVGALAEATRPQALISTEISKIIGITFLLLFIFYLLSQIQ
jgi:hypothetical protein